MYNNNKIENDNLVLVLNYDMKEKKEWKPQDCKTDADKTCK